MGSQGNALERARIGTTVGAQPSRFLAGKAMSSLRGRPKNEQNT
jgi:hypothetical protein